MTKLPRVSLPQKPLVVCAPSVDVSARLLSQVCPGQQHTLLASTVHGTDVSLSHRLHQSLPQGLVGFLVA